MFALFVAVPLDPTPQRVQEERDLAVEAIPTAFSISMNLMVS
jgi:hypothetical protein